MKITIYGLITNISFFIMFSLLNIFTIKNIIIFVLSILSQKFMCSKCSSQFHMASYMCVLPLLVVILSDCKDIKIIFQAFSIFAAISRIGCYFAGCCTGVECDKECLSILYEGEYSVNKKLKKKKCYVKPTIIYEIIIQILFAIIMLINDKAYLYFPILNAVLIYLSNFWRMEPRMLENKHYPLIFLSVTFIINLWKCNNIEILENINFKTKNLKKNLILSVILGLAASNDFNINNLL